MPLFRWRGATSPHRCKPSTSSGGAAVTNAAGVASRTSEPVRARSTASHWPADSFHQGREGPVEYKVLGPVEVVDDARGGQPVDLGSRKQRALLALLLVNANRVVSLDSLVAQLWPARAPA